MSAGTAAKARARTSPVIEPACVSMARRMPAQRAQRTAKTDPRGRDFLAAAAAMAHADAERGKKDREAMRRYGTSRRSHSRWRTEGPPALRDAGAYLLACSDPFRADAFLRATDKMRVLARLSDAALIERYHELLRYEPQVEANDRVLDVSRGVSWMDRAAASERDAAIEAEKAACAREFARRGLTEAEVFGR